ncbi:hypothetical protein D9V86_03015 [Bacteroidetes/Chlorobi group bacterium ChocPot_Mid]|nr:MAG: hypothetical protein D9V86_03015 [Bacteroidetes/Chlorobi group bacterium ChocPot_Mid]
MKKNILVFVLLLLFHFGCGNDNPNSWKQISDNNYITAQVSGAINIFFEAQKIRTDILSVSDSTLLISVESECLIENFIYSMRLTFPVDKVGKFINSSNIDAYFTLGNKNYQFGWGYINIQESKSNVINGNFEFTGYQWEVNKDSSYIKDSIKISNGSFNILK